jgi:hypothetical protein
VPADVDRRLGVEGGGRGDDQRERGFNQKVCIGLLLPLDANRIGQEEKISPRSLWSQREDPGRSPSSSWSVCRKRRETRKKEREKAMVRVFESEIQIQIESFKLGLKFELG